LDVFEFDVERLESLPFHLKLISTRTWYHVTSDVLL
jgi:hypothetical protein